MRKRIWAVLLSVCLLVGLLPTTALAADTGQVTLSLNYDESLCSIRVIDGNTQSEESPTVFVSGNGQSASVPSGSWAIFQITNIRDGYRIGSVTLNGTDRTRSFVNGAYGGLGISNISRDYALTAVMEEIPETLPSVTSVTLYTDEAGTQPAAENIAYTSESTEAQLFGKATFSDGVEYPVYYTRGQWQFTTDGTTWQDTESWGSNRFDFSPGWPYHEELDFLTDSYDIRLKVNPQDLYTTGSSVYSNVIHINGGVGAAPTDPENPATDVVLYVDGVDMANGGTVDGAVYTAATNTLTLTNASITGYYADADTGTRAGIYYQSDATLNIKLSGKNTVSISCTSDQIGYGIDSSGPVTITGSGTLDFQTRTDGESTKGYGATAILATDLTVTGGAAVTADLPTVGTYDNLGSIVSLSGDLTVSNDASLTATGKYEAVKTSGDVNIATGGSLTAKAITAVNAGGSVTVENGSFTADAVGTSADMGYAVKFAGDMTVSGDSAQVLVNQSEDASYAYGLYNTSACDLTIGGGTVKIANGSNGTHQAIRLQNSASTFTLTGGDVTVTGGTGLYYGLYNAGTANISDGVLRHTGDLYIGGLTTLSGEANVAVSGAAYLNGLTMQDSAALDVTNSTGTAVTSYKAVQVTGGTLTASSETSDALNLTSGDLTVDGGTVDLTGGRYGLYLSNTNGSNLIYESGVLSASGSNGAVVWFSWDTDFSANSPTSIAAGTPITPAGAKLLTATMDGAYAAAYVTSDTDALTYEGTTVTNAVKSITFGTASDVVLYVNGMDMVNGSGTVDGAVYNADTNTLTLTDANITGYYTTTGTLDGAETDIRAGIYYKGAETLNIVLADSSENTVTLHPSRDGDAEYGNYIAAVGIYADGSVKIESADSGSLAFGSGTITEGDAIFDTKVQEAYVYAQPIHVTDYLTVGGSANVDGRISSFKFDTAVELHGWTYNSASNAAPVQVYAGDTLHVTGTAVFRSGSAQADGMTLVDSGTAQITTLRGGDVQVKAGTLTSGTAAVNAVTVSGGTVNINSLAAGDVAVSGGTLTTNQLSAADLTVTGGTLTAEASSTNTKLTGTIEVSGDANISSGTVTAEGGIQSAYETGSYVSTTGSFSLSGDGSVTAHGIGVRFGGAVSVSGNARLTATDVTDSAITGCQGVTIADNAVVTAAGPFAGIQVGSYNASGVFRMTGGTLTATAASTDSEYPCNMALYVMAGSVEFSGGHAELISAPGCGIFFADTDKAGLGDFSVTGGYLKVSGTRGGVIWQGSSGLPAVTRAVTVKTDPEEIQYLGGSLDYTSSGYEFTAYAATYTGSDVTALDIDLDHNGWPTNGLTAITFGAEPCTEHDWGDWVEPQAPTCTGKGAETRTCAVCGETETRETDALGHDYVAVVTAPTCEEQGYTTHTCSRCGDSYVGDYTDALSHDYAAVVTAPTCSEKGYTTHTCSRCGDSYVDDYTDALSHDYAAVVTAPTCSEKGYTTHTCSRCGDSYVDTYENALGHYWDEGVITTPPTLDAEGVKTFTCQRCGETRTEAVAKLKEQNIMIPGTSFKKTYGDADFSNEAKNLTDGGGALTYTSSNTAVARVDAQSGKVTIEGAGDAVITVTAAAVANQYTETSVTYTVSVAKAPLTITANDKAITYGEKASNDGYAITGFVNGEDESVLSGEAVYSYTYKQYGNVGEYQISVSGLTAKNYAITFVDGKLTVGKATKYTITLSDLEQLAGHVSGVTARIDPYDTSADLSVEYLVDNSWTATAPQAAGTYQVRAALTDSNNIVVPTSAAYTTGTLTVKPGVTVDTGNGPTDVDVAVEVTGGTAEITVTEEDLTKITENANGQVSIDLGSVSDVDTLVLPGDLVGELSKSDKAERLTVSTENASVTLSADVLDTVAKTVTGGEDTVSVRLESVAENELTPAQQDALNAITTDYPVAVVDVSLVVTHADGSTDTLHELGGDVTVTVPYEQLPGLMDGQYVVACYISDDGTVTYLFAQAYEANRTITFTTNHFSNYAVFVSGKPASSVTVSGGSGSGIYLAGDTVTIKADSKSGYTFAGWEVVSDGVTLADATAAETTFTMPTANVELKATYTKNSSGGGGGVSTYTLTFDTNGGSKIDSVSKTSGATIDLTGYVPTRAGYDFDGWYSDAKLTDKITSVKLTKNMTVYAKWTEKSGENPFTDVADDAYYADAVIWAVGKGITSGTTATTFTPNNPCTRAQAVTFLWRAAGSPAPRSTKMPFADVAADAYYRDAVLWAVEQGITKGTSDTAFSPNAACTRAQIVTFLWRAQGNPEAGTDNPFTDVAVDAYYADAVLWAVENGVTSGTTATTFSPNSDCTRAQIVTFLFRCLGGE